MFNDWKQKIAPPTNHISSYPRGLNLKNRSNLPVVNQPNVEPQNRRVPATLPPPPTVPTKVMKWGAPTWTLFHTLAQKINEKDFSRLSKELIDLIKTVCNTLPCPDCASHATEYVSRVNWNLINTKQQLIDLLWQFHNDVNKRKGYPLFNRDLLEQTYGGKNVVEVVRVFMYHYEDKHSKGPNSAIAQKYNRQRISSRLKSWFNVNIQFFSLQIPPLA